MAMSEAHRDILRRNRVLLVKNVIINDELLSSLMAADSKVLTADMKETVESQKIRSAKVSCLLDILVKRGKDAFGEFIKALVETEQGHLAEKLDAKMTEYYKQLHDQEENGGSDDKPDYPVDDGRICIPKTLAGKAKDIQDNNNILEKVLMVSNAEINKYLNELRNERAYRITGRCRGRALIISNEYFADDRLKAREGNGRDVENLEGLFTMLDFEVEVLRDCTDKDLYKFLEKECGDQRHSSADMLIVCLLSHGVDGHIYTLNGKCVSIENVVSYFEPEMCPHLTDKPKVFIVQACQQAPRPVRAADDSVDGGYDATDATVSASGLENLATIVHSKSDVLVARSTVSGYVANRHTVFGSLYIRCLVYVLSRNVHKEHVVDMLTEVTDIMKHIKTAGGDVQLAELKFTFGRKLYLMPGFNASLFPH